MTISATRMIEDDNPVAGQADASAFVIRLSRTAKGERTYTLGASLGMADDPLPVVRRLFDLERLVTSSLEPRKGNGPSLQAELRRSLLIEALRKGTGWNGSKDFPERGRMTTTELVEAVKGHRSQVVADLAALVKDGTVEYERGKGGNYPSRYRLVQS